MSEEARAYLQALTQQPVIMVILILIGLFLLFWVFVSVAIMVSSRAREYFSSFLPQWWGRKGRPFTTHEKIGAFFQGIALVLIFILLFYHPA